MLYFAYHEIPNFYTNIGKQINLDCLEIGTQVNLQVKVSSHVVGIVGNPCSITAFTTNRNGSKDKQRYRLRFRRDLIKTNRKTNRNRSLHRQYQMMMIGVSIFLASKIESKIARGNVREQNSSRYHHLQTTPASQHHIQ